MTAQPRISHDSIIDLISANAEAVAECFERCFELPVTLTPQTAVDWSDSIGRPDLQSAGLAVHLQAGAGELLLLIPETLPLPDWYKSPDVTQSSRLETLAMEWSSILLPDEAQGGLYRTETVSSLLSCVQMADPSDDAIWLQLLVEGEGIAGAIHVYFPVSSGGGNDHDYDDYGDYGSTHAESSVSQARQNDAQSGRNRIRRLMPLKVPVSVRLAEKRIALGQLINIAPGGLITFPKSCDDLLDLYVNNRLYAKGEAVKIGEKFGIKINEVGVENVRISGIFTL